MKEFLFVIWVTNRCNFRCNYCYEKGIEDSNDMLMSTAKSVVEYIKLFVVSNCINNCRVVFHGGEPTLNLNVVINMIDELRAIKQCVFSFGMTTNGYKLTSKAIDIIDQYIDDLTVSIDGNSKMHDMCRLTKTGETTYSSVINTALSLKKNKSIRIRMTINPDNYLYLAEGIIDLIKLGFIEIVPGIDVFDSRYTEEIFERIETEFLKVKEYRETNESQCYIAFLEKSEIKTKGICNGGITSLNIDVYGNLYPCTYLVNNEEYVIGSVLEGIDTMKLELLRSSNNGTVSECEGCQYIEYCSTNRCRYVNKILMNEYDIPSPVVCATERLRLHLCR